MHTTIQLLDLGTVPYGQALRLQHQLHQQLVEQSDPSKRIGYLIALQHPLTVTIGKRGESSALLGRQSLKEARAEVFRIDRGGEATLHNPGQLVLYPILKLDDYSLGVTDLVRKTAAAAANAMALHRIEAEYDNDLPGLWVEYEPSHMEECHYFGESRRKLASVGMRISRGTSTHGIAINVTNDLTPFSWIAACGMTDPPMGRVEDLDKKIVFAQFKEEMLREWASEFELELIPKKIALPNKEEWERENVEW